MIDSLKDLALVAVIGFAGYAALVLIIALTGPHNEYEKREGDRHDH